MLRGTRWLLLSALVLSAPALGACSNRAVDEMPVTPAPGPDARLTAPGGCEELVEGLVADAHVRLDIEMQAHLDEHADGIDGYVAIDDPEPPPPATHRQLGGGSLTGGVSVPVGETASATADVVAVQADRIFVLRADRLFVLRAAAGDPSIELELEVEGRGRGLFVAADRVVVLSETGDPRDATCADVAAACEPRYVKIAVADLSGTGPSITREVYVEGAYRGALREGARIHALVTEAERRFGGEAIPDVWEYLYPAALDYEGPLPGPLARARIADWRRDAGTFVERRTLDDWLPDTLERTGGTRLTELPPDCAGYHLSAAGLVAHGTTRIVGFDLDDGSSPVTETTVWGAPRTVVATERALFVVQDDDSIRYRARVDERPTVETRSLLHRFALGPGPATWERSGFVPGHLVDARSLDPGDGLLRVATTQAIWQAWWLDTDADTAPETVHRVLTLEPEGDRLVVAGRSDPVADGQHVAAARFAGQIAFLAPLDASEQPWAVDLSDPRAPSVIGPVEAPGVGTYVQPLGDGRLLTVGYEDAAAPGPTVSILDVTQPATPRRLHQHYVADPDLWTTIRDHAAFSFDATRGLLAFDRQAAGDRWSDYRTVLEVLSIDAESGVTPIATLDHTSLLETWCNVDDWGCRMQETRVYRSVLADDTVHSISNGGVVALPLSTLTEPGIAPAPLTLPTPL